eukprot:SAG11_NODE_2622_length_3167_cov_3.968057_1_plen_260_part_00
MEDHGQRRALLGDAINRINLRYRDMQVSRRLQRGEQVDLQRVPCPEIALQRLVVVGSVAHGDDLFWCACLLLMAICWFRAATVARMQPGDVRFDGNGGLVVVVRECKGRPEFRVRPALVQIPAPAQNGSWRRIWRRHPRETIFRVLRRFLRSEPRGFGRLGQLVSARARGGGAAAMQLTAEFRRLVPPHTLNLPAGAVVASHSFREMGATTAVQAHYSAPLACAHGLWQRLSTMNDSYVFLWSPFSRWFAVVLDFLRSV